MIQFDLEIAIICMLCPGGVGVDLYDEYNWKDELHNIIIQADEWDMYQRYDYGLQIFR